MVNISNKEAPRWPTLDLRAPIGRYQTFYHTGGTWWWCAWELFWHQLGQYYALGIKTNGLL